MFFNFTKKKLFIFSCEIMIKNGNTNFCKKYSVKWFWSKFKKCVKLLNRIFAFMSVSFSFVLTYTIIYLPTFGMGCKLQIFETKKKSSLLLKTDAKKKVWGKKFQLGVLLLMLILYFALKNSNRKNLIFSTLFLHLYQENHFRSTTCSKSIVPCNCIKITYI